MFRQENTLLMHCDEWQALLSDEALQKPLLSKQTQSEYLLAQRMSFLLSDHERILLRRVL